MLFTLDDIQKSIVKCRWIPDKNTREWQFAKYKTYKNDYLDIETISLLKSWFKPDTHDIFKFLEVTKYLKSKQEESTLFFSWLLSGH